MFDSHILTQEHDTKNCHFNKHQLEKTKMWPLGPKIGICTGEKVLGRPGFHWRYWINHMQMNREGRWRRRAPVWVRLWCSMSTWNRRSAPSSAVCHRTAKKRNAAARRPGNGNRPFWSVDPTTPPNPTRNLSITVNKQNKTHRWLQAIRLNSLDLIGTRRRCQWGRFNFSSKSAVSIQPIDCC